MLKVTPPRFALRTDAFVLKKMALEGAFGNTTTLSIGVIDTSAKGREGT